MKTIKFCFSLSLFKLTLLYLTTFILKHNKWSNYQKSYKNNLIVDSYEKSSKGINLRYLFKGGSSRNIKETLSGGI